jgi:proteic killer suppression protein
VIISFGNDDTRKVFNGEVSRRLPQNIQAAAHRKLLLIHAATFVNSLSVPPGNRLEQLKGNRAGQYSIRINDQWRICFEFKDATLETAPEVSNVEITDYH